MSVNFVRLLSLSMGISSLFATEYHLVTTILLIFVYICISYFEITFILPALIGYINYASQQVSGGFTAGILLGLSLPKGSRYYSLSAAIIFTIASLVVWYDQSLLHSHMPFGLKWWFDLGTAVIVANCLPCRIIKHAL